MVTVNECAIEEGSGNKSRKGYVAVDDATLRKTATILKPNIKQLAAAALLLRGVFLDDGERDLIACALARPGAWLLCSSDKAAVRAMHTVGKLAQAVSLEALARAA